MSLTPGGGLASIGWFSAFNLAKRDLCARTRANRTDLYLYRDAVYIP